MAAAETDALVDPLYEAPPTEFVAARKRIVAALKQAGRAAEAKAIEKLPRPPVQIWTANQVARRDGDLVTKLIRLSDRLRVVGGVDYAAVAGEHRQLLAELRDSAEKVLTGAGHGADPQILQRVLATMRAAVASAEHRPLFEGGRLVRDVDEPEAANLFSHGPAPAVDATATAKPISAIRAKPAPALEDKQRERERARERAALERRIEKLTDYAATSHKEVDKAERADADARKAAAAAADRLARTRQLAQDAARELATAEADLARLR